MAIFKVFLMVGLIFYTFVTMVGGNPDHDAYGFRYWDNPVSGKYSFSSLRLIDVSREHLWSILFPGARDGFWGYFPA